MHPSALTSLITAVPLPIMVIGAAQQVTAVNDQLEHLLGDHLVGRHFITALRQPVLVEAVERAIADKTAVQSLYLGRDSGQDTTFDVAIRPYGDGVLLSFTDQTAAHQVGQLRRDFVANVSHELRTPLTALFGFIETLRGSARNDPAAQDRFLGIMEREATRMITLVDDLLALSRVETDERVRPDAQVPIGDLVRATITEMEPVIRAQSAQVRFHDDSGGARILADQHQMRQVIGNLVENAVKYGPDEGEVMITLSGASYAQRLRCNALTLVVRDQGPGIASHHIPRLTERFYRVDDHRSRDIGGTGLGLAIVKHIINRHRGRLDITSALGQGTSVTVTLPISPG